MRRMRDFFNGWVITLVVTAAVGYFAVRHWPSHPGDQAMGTREPAAEKESGHKTAKTAAQHSSHAADQSSDLEIEEHEVAEVGNEAHMAPHSKEATHAEHGADSAALAREIASLRDAGTREACSSIEYRGSSLQAGRITTEQWGKVMTQFHFAKRDLLAWLEQHHGEFSKEVAEHMENDVRELRLQRPPTPDYPDLAFRGIGIWTRPLGERPIIKLGGGFAKLAEHHPMRAKFELARLIAQTWSPCELKRSTIASRLPAEGPWGKLLGCLTVHEEATSCAPGGFSEAGWAVSTAVAAVASPAGCMVPAFAAPMGDRCLDELRAHEGPRMPASVSGHGVTSVHAPTPTMPAATHTTPTPVKGAHHE